MKIKLFQFLEGVLARLGKHIETARQKVAVCPDCGRNRYTGPPCVNFNTQEVSE